MTDRHPDRQTDTHLTAFCLGLLGEPVPESENQSGLPGASDSQWQWHQLGHMQISSSPLSFYWLVHFLLPNHQRQSTEGNCDSWQSTITLFHFVVNNVSFSALTGHPARYSYLQLPPQQRFSS